jgi:deoxyribonuclease V
MKARELHSWNVTPREAAQIQRDLRPQLVLRDQLGAVSLVAGADIALDKREQLGFGGVIVYTFPGLEEVERQTSVCPLTFPYVPGLLAFREAPVLLEAFAKLRSEPDVLVFDAHGYSHPRRMGLASHLGLVFDKPSIGCAKSVLVGDYEEPPSQAGAWTPLVHGGETVAAAVRTRDGVKPVFVSCGHRVSLETAIRVMLQCTVDTRIPKPTREAD